MYEYVMCDFVYKLFSFYIVCDLHIETAIKRERSTLKGEGLGGILSIESQPLEQLIQRVGVSPTGTIKSLNY